MTDAPAPISVPEPESPALDFSQFRTRELVKRVADSVVSPAEVFRSAIKWSFVGALVVSGLTAAILEPYGGLITVSGTALAFPLGLLAGVVWGVSSLLRKKVDGFFEMLGLLIEIAAQVGHQWRQIRGERPPAPEILAEVYRSIFVPVLEQVCSELFGILARPVLLIYRISLGRAVRAIIAGKIRSGDADADRIFATLDDMADSTEDTDGVTRALDLVERIRRPLRAFIILPLNLITFGLWTLILGPLVALCILIRLL